MAKNTSLSFKFKTHVSRSKTAFFKVMKDSFTWNGRLVFLLPYLIVSLLFILVPMIMLVVRASSEVDGASPTQLVADPGTWEIMARSVYLGLIAAVISLILAFPFAFIVGRSKSRVFRLVSIALLLSPLFVFTIAKVFALKILLLQMFDNPNNFNNQFVMVIGMVYLYMPFIIVPLYSVIQQMPSNLVDASKDLGFNHVSSVFRVVVPYTLKAIFSSIALVFMLASTSIVISEVLTPKPSLKMIGQVMNEQAEAMRNNDLAAAWGSTVALVTIAVMMGVYVLIYLVPVLIRKFRGGVSV